MSKMADTAVTWDVADSQSGMSQETHKRRRRQTTTRERECLAMAVAIATRRNRPGPKESTMKYQYQMGGMFEDVIEGVLKGAGDIYTKEKERIKEQEDKKRKTADDEATKKKKPDEGLLDKVMAPVKKAAEKKASSDI